MTPPPTANAALPSQSGTILQRSSALAASVGSGGWMSSYNLSLGSTPMTYYSLFDVSSYGVQSIAPRVYKKLAFTPITDETSGEPTGKMYNVITTFPLYTVIITLAGGVPQSVSWDDGCFFCAANTASCAHNMFDANSSVYDIHEDDAYKGCSMDMAMCYPLVTGGKLVATADLAAAASPTPSQDPSPSSSPSRAPVTNSTVSVVSDCDLKVFVVWTGTDAAGNYLQSANKRFSRFRQFSIVRWFCARRLSRPAILLAHHSYHPVIHTLLPFTPVYGVPVCAQPRKRRLEHCVERG